MDEIIRQAVTPLVPVCVPNQYGGAALEYAVYNYSEIPDAFGDDAPNAVRYLVQVHWFYPWAQGASAQAAAVEKRRALRRALAAAGMTWPTVTPAGDRDYEHYVFECEYADGSV